MTKHKKLISIRKPRLRINSKGLHITKPSARVGGRFGLNISSRGISASARTKRGTLSTRTGYTSRVRRTTKRAKGCLTLALPIALAAILAILTTANRSAYVSK